MQKRWKISAVAPERANALQTALGIDPALCQVLAGRGMEDAAAANAFFHPKLKDLHDPWSMKDMRKAVDRILSAMEAREKIWIYGDYDADGTTAVACLVHFLHKRYVPELVDFYIPHRHHEGYGISRTGIDLAKEKGFQLIISLDCGIKSAEMIDYARSLGIDFIVCDHHTPDARLPDAVAILNPKQADCPYPYKELSGCGVGFKLIAALADEMGLPAEEPWRYLDLVATAIAGDIVPMDGENRILAYHGLEKANREPNSGIRALARLSGMSQELRSNSLVYMIAPRINAAGRMGDARKSVLLFTSTDPGQSEQYAQQLIADNNFRKIKDNSVTEEAFAMLEKDETHPEKKSTVLFQPHWHKGVVGIVASRLIEKYYRPTVVLTGSGDLIAGSARSVSGFNVYEAVHACRDHLVEYGGHYAAAGMTLLPGQMDAFKRKFEETVAAMIGAGSLVPEIIVDAELPFGSVTPAFYETLQRMQPFGPGNSDPVFLTRGVLDTGYSRVVKGNHIRFSLHQGVRQLDGIGFGLADKFHLLSADRPVDIVFTVEESDWNGQKNLRLKILDLEPSCSTDPAPL